MIIFITAAVIIIIAVTVYLIGSDTDKQILVARREADEAKRIARGFKLDLEVRLKAQRDELRALIDQNTTAANSAYQMANNAMLREKRVITVRHINVKMKPKKKPTLLEKSGVVKKSNSAVDMEKVNNFKGAFL